MDFSKLESERNKLISLHSSNPLFSYGKEKFTKKILEYYNKGLINDNQYRYLNSPLMGKMDGINSGRREFLDNVLNHYRIRTRTFVFISDINGFDMSLFYKLCCTMKPKLYKIDYTVNSNSLRGKVLELIKNLLSLCKDDEFGYGYDVITCLKVMWSSLIMNNRYPSINESLFPIYIDVLENYYISKKKELEKLFISSGNSKVSYYTIVESEVLILRKLLETRFNVNSASIYTVELSKKLSEDSKGKIEVVDLIRIIEQFTKSYFETNRDLEYDFRLVNSRPNDFEFFIKRGNCLDLTIICEIITDMFSPDNIIERLKESAYEDFLKRDDSYINYLKLISARLGEYTAAGLASYDNFYDNFHHLADQEGYGFNMGLVNYYYYNTLDFIERHNKVILEEDVYDSKRHRIDYTNIFNRNGDE